MTTPSKVVPALSFLIGVATLLLSGAALADEFYNVIELGTLTNESTPGFNDGFVAGINASGQLTGLFGGSVSQAFITGPNGVGLRYLGISDSIGYGINNLGQVTGLSSAGAFFTGPNGMGITYFPGSGPTFLVGKAINASGQVTGYSSDGRVFITGPNGVGVTYLNVPAAGFGSNPLGMNDSGQVVGFFPVNPFGDHGFMTGPNGVGVTDLGAGSANGINASGQVTGTNAAGHAFITGPNGIGMTDLGTLGGPSSSGSGINDLGEVVGQNGSTFMHGIAFIYDGGPLVDLNTLIPTFTSDYLLTAATAINDSGQIVATGYDCNTHQDEWFLLTPESSAAPGPTGQCSRPVPEPGTLSLFGFGLGAVIVQALRRRKSA